MTGRESGNSAAGGAHALPPVAGEVMPDPDFLAAFVEWARTERAVSVPVLTAAVGAFAAYLVNVFSQGLRSGWARVYEIPTEFVPVSPSVAALGLLVAAAFAAAVTSFALLTIDALRHRGVRFWILVPALVINLLRALREYPVEQWWSTVLTTGRALIESPLDADWSSPLAFSFSVFAGWVALEFLGAMAKRLRRRVAPPRTKPWWIPGRPWGGVWAWAQASSPLRSAGLVVQYALIGVVVAIAVAWATNWAGRWAGQEVFGPSLDRVLLLDTGGTPPSATRTLVFVDGDRILERKVTTVPGEDRTYVPCGSIIIRTLGDREAMHIEQDLGSVVPGGQSVQPC